MGLFDGYFDPQQFEGRGGLLGRLLSLQPQQGLNQSAVGFDQASSAPQAPVLAAMPWPNLPDHGRPLSDSQGAAQDIHSQYQALRSVLGDRNAMLATVHPDVGKTLIAQALAHQQSDNSGNSVPAGDGQPVVSDASPDPLRPGSQYAQASLGLCLGGPAGCLAGTGLMAGQILGGAALGGLGAVILNNQRNRPAPGDKPASTPTGKRGSPIDVTPGTNQPTSIGDRIYTGHAADQMQGRGVPPSAVEDAIQNGQASPGNTPGTTVHTGTNGVVVVTGSDGQVVTVINK